MPHQCTGCGHTFEDGSKEMLSGCPDCGGNKFQFRPAGASSEASAVDAEADAQADAPSDTPPSDRPSDASSEPPADGSSVAKTVGRATTRVRDLVSSGPEPPATDRSADSTPDPAAEWPDDWSNDPGEAHRAESTRDDSTDAKSGAPDPNAHDETSEATSDGDIIDADARRSRKEDGEDRTEEDLAQANARSDVVSAEELHKRSVDADTADGSAPDGDSDPDSASDSSDPSAPSEGTVVSEPTGEEPDLTDLREQLNDQFESIKILEPGQYELNLMELYDREEYIIALQENGRYVIQVPEQWIGDDPDDR